MHCQSIHQFTFFNGKIPLNSKIFSIFSEKGKENFQKFTEFFPLKIVNCAWNSDCQCNLRKIVFYYKYYYYLICNQWFRRGIYNRKLSLSSINCLLLLLKCKKQDENFTIKFKWPSFYQNVAFWSSAPPSLGIIHHMNSTVYFFIHKRKTIIEALRLHTISLYLKKKSQILCNFRTRNKTFNWTTEVLKVQGGY